MTESMNKILLRRNIPFSEFQKLTVRNVAFKVIDIMTKHIGRDDAIARNKLFFEIYHKDEEDSPADWFRWEMIKKAMYYCRKKTKCFIVTIQQGQRFKFFVLQDYEDADIYIKRLDKNIHQMRKMQERSMQAAKEEWYKENWLLPERKKRKKIEHKK